MLPFSIFLRSSIAIVLLYAPHLSLMHSIQRNTNIHTFICAPLIEIFLHKMHFIQLLLLSFCIFFLHQNNKHWKMSVSILFLWRKKACGWISSFSCIGFFCWMPYALSILFNVIVPISCGLLYAFSEIRYGTACKNKRNTILLLAHHKYTLLVVYEFFSVSLRSSISFFSLFLHFGNHFITLDKCAHKSYGCVHSFFAQSSQYKWFSF